MFDQSKKRRGPLLWLADGFRRRPVLAVTLSLVLPMLAAFSTIGTMMFVQQQRANEQRRLAEVIMMAQRNASQAVIEALQQQLEERRALDEQPAEERSDEAPALQPSDASP